MVKSQESKALPISPDNVKVKHPACFTPGTLGRRAGAGKSFLLRQRREGPGRANTMIVLFCPLGLLSDSADRAPILISGPTPLRAGPAEPRRCEPGGGGGGGGRETSLSHSLTLRGGAGFSFTLMEPL